MLASIVIRTLNEGVYLEELLLSIKAQQCNFDVEIVIIDSGSTDKTLQIADLYDARVTHIHREDFSFGRSLNMGSEYAKGDILVYISGHCIPVNEQWLSNLVNPILLEGIDYTYGKQLGRDTTKYSEYKIFSKYFSDHSSVPQDNFFCNNANSALTRKAWKKFKFNEDLTGLEDMDLAKRLFNSGGKIGYISEAGVFHIHNETWNQTRRRYERESIALQSIMPEIQINFFDMVRYIVSSIVSDSKSAIRDKCFLKKFHSICLFRFAQYSGSYRGNLKHRELSIKRKESYFYPTKNIQD